MEYNNTAPFSGNPEKALELSLNVFLIQSFAIIEKSESGHELEGAGIWNSPQNPLMAVSRVKVSIEDKRIALSAEFGGVRQLQRFLIYWIGGLTLLFIGLVFLVRDVANPLVLSSPALVLPFLLLIPLVSRMARKRAEKALDTLLNNMNAVS